MTGRREERIAMAREICLYRGENPNTIDRGGNEGWEKYEPLAGACIREAERLFARRTGAVTEPLKQPQYIIEGIILRRLHQKRIEGYTIETAKEVADALALTSPQQQKARPDLRRLLGD
jgi:hypothetical protein